MFLTACLYTLTAYLVYSLLRPRKQYSNYDFAGKSILITGASSGLGLAIAGNLLRRGAKRVVLLARGEKGLQEAKRRLQEVAPNDTNMERVFIVPMDVTSAGDVAKLFPSLNHPVDVVFCCAGTSHPCLVQDLDTNQAVMDMQLNYFGTLNVIQAALKQWRVEGTPSSKGPKKVVLVGSTLSVLNMIGYPGYAPTKWAIRSLAECLRQEFLVNPKGTYEAHVYYVSTINTPGYEAESATKPAITQMLEGPESSDASPESRAETLCASISQGRFAICSDLVTRIIYLTATGGAPWEDPWIVHLAAGTLSGVLIQCWSRWADWSIKGYGVKTHVKAQ